MALECFTNINVDFYDKKYILVNAKQLDKQSRFLSVTCYNHGELFPLNQREHGVYIRYKKADGYSVFNSCNIDNEKIVVELTEQMLAASGICDGDLVLVSGGKVEVDPETGEIIGIDRKSILSTMPFHIDVTETAVDNSDIESSYEFSAFNQALATYWSDFEEVMKTAKAWAVGNTSGSGVPSDTNNAKYYAELAADNANSSSANATAAVNAAESASRSAASASTSATNAANSEGNAKTYKDYIEGNIDTARQAAQDASNSLTLARESAESASDSAESALGHSSTAQGYAGEAEVYYRQAEAIVQGLNGAFLPKGTITFAELAEIKNSGTVGTGYLYNISDNFVTDDNFRIGAGVSYDAGANVYFTVDGQWDVLTGTTVTGVKGIAETVYRKGNVELTAENVGAIPNADIATVDEVTSYLGI